MKKLMLITIYTIATTTLFGQSTLLTAPSTETELCPNTNNIFTVTVPGYDPSIFSWTNAPVVVSASYPPIAQAPSTTFTFVANFRDVNIAQSFGIRYKRENQADVTEYITFKKIKSLFYPNPVGTIQSSPCQVFKADQQSITAPICQITNIPISVPTTNWSTPNEGNDFCWGTISTFEYQLPVNWKIGSSFTSNGNNWYTGSTNVTVTTDLANGANGVIRVRPTNTCGTGLVNNSIHAIIAINRPRPTLSFNGSTPICSTANFQANNLPTWVTTTNWSVAPEGLINISNSSANPTIFTRIGNGIASVRFSITGGPACPVTFNYETQEIVNDTKLEVGAPIVTWPHVFYPLNECLPMGFNVTYTTTSQFSAWYEWGYYEGVSGNSNPYVLVSSGGTSQQPIRVINTESINRIVVKGGNACGTGLPNIKEFTFSENCNSGPDVEYRMKQKNNNYLRKPNKFEIIALNSNSLLQIQVPKNTNKQNIIVNDLNGRLVKTLMTSSSHVVTIDISSLPTGLYFIRLLTTDNQKVLKFIKY